MLLWPICGQFCGLICECLWHVQRMVLRAVWSDFSLFKGCLDCFWTVYDRFYGLLVADFMVWFVSVYGMFKELVKRLFGWIFSLFYGRFVAYLMA